MKIQGHLRDYPLPILLEVLADRHESGCLRIAFEPEPAILYFRRGQLVDARMSLLEGSAAINLALSMGQAPFNFDNDIVPPQSIIDNHDRAILSRLIGVRLSAENETGPVRVVEHSTVKPSFADVRLPEPSVTSYLESAAITRTQQPVNLEQSPRAELSVQSKYLENAHKVFNYSPRRTLLRTVVVILVVAVPAAVGLTVRFGKRIVTSPESAVYEQPTTAQQSNFAPVSSHPISGSSSAQAVSIEPTTRPTPFTVNDNGNKTSPAAAQAPKIIAESESSEVISEVTKVTEGAGLVPDSSSRQETRLVPTTKTIVVEVQFEQGRVTGAWIKNPRKGLEAFEAAAIRVIRRHRYSKESTGTDSVSVDVTVNQ